MNNFFRKTLNLLLLMLLLYSVYNIYLKLNDYSKAQVVYNEIESDIKANKYEELSLKYPDFRFWIEVDNTNISYPVLQGKDNNYYLDKDINLNKLSSGSIFMDYRNDFNTDKNILIYGHNMKNKTMFSQLEKFKSNDFFNENNKVIIKTSDKQYTYEVFSAYYVKSSFNYLLPSFDDDVAYRDYLDTAKSMSLTKSDLDVTVSDKIITLSTCSYESKDTRTVVHAKLISCKNL